MTFWKSKKNYTTLAETVDNFSAEHHKLWFTSSPPQKKYMFTSKFSCVINTVKCV